MFRGELLVLGSVILNQNNFFRNIATERCFCSFWMHRNPIFQIAFCLFPEKTTITMQYSPEILLLPRKLTWNPKMEVWKMIFLFKQVIFRFHVSFRGCTCNFRKPMAILNSSSPPRSCVLKTTYPVVY